MWLRRYVARRWATSSVNNTQLIHAALNKAVEVFEISLYMVKMLMKRQSAERQQGCSVRS
jgi:hypothetical protein